MVRYILTGNSKRGDKVSLPEITLSDDVFVPQEIHVYEGDLGEEHLVNVYKLQPMKQPTMTNEQFHHSYFGTSEPEARAKIILDMILSALKEDPKIALSIIEANLLPCREDYFGPSGVEIVTGMTQDEIRDVLEEKNRRFNTYLDSKKCGAK